ncbi:helix-turn-helix transcriptional regulator [Streptomyces sp. NPDC001315]|uniref:helix-turn-helix transcriptional regulator n=1 Tax=Streptomyces sp. NPDC001315 TaxID=3364562 RepID=UPI0036AE4DDF
MPEQQPGGGTELGHFLRARRTHITPADVGLTPGAGVRRTPGLRREEVAALAGVSIDYYTRLERGKETRPSLAVVEALGRALKLDEDELGHLHDLVVRAARHAPEPPTAPSRTVSPQVKQILENLRPSPAYVTSRTLDLLAHNTGALNLYAGIEDWPAKQRNLARFLFLHPAARDLYVDWDTQIAGCVARLRALAGTDPDAPDLASLIGELLLKSKDFAKLWERYEVTRRTHTKKQKTFHHPQVGQITLAFQGMQLEGTPGHRLGVYTAAPGTPEYDAVVLLDMIGPRPVERPVETEQPHRRT